MTSPPTKSGNQVFDIAYGNRGGLVTDAATGSVQEQIDARDARGLTDGVTGGLKQETERTKLAAWLARHVRKDLSNLVNQEADIQDVVQQTCLVLTRKQKWGLPAHRVYPYAETVAYRLALKRKKEGAREYLLGGGAEALSSPAGSPEEALLREEEHLSRLKTLNERARRLAGSLPARERRQLIAVISGKAEPGYLLLAMIRAAAASYPRVKEREAFLLHDVEKVGTWVDVASRLGNTHAAARKAGERGREAVVTMLERYGISGEAVRACLDISGPTL